MSILVTIIVFLLIFSVLILIHEAGHFFMARRAGILVEEFGFGLPPRLWGKKIGETMYSLNAIPFGGFVRMLGEDAKDPSVLKKKRSFVAKNLRARILVVIAGVCMNFFLAIVLLTIGFSVGIEPLIVTGDDLIDAIQSGVAVIDPRAETGAKNGNIIYVPRVRVHRSAQNSVVLKDSDIILAVNGKELFSVAELTQALSEEKESPIRLLRDGAIEEVLLKNPLPYPVIISDVIPDSPAARAGFLAGDIVMRLDGVDMYSPESLTKAIQSKKEKAISFLISRKGIEQIRMVTPDTSSRIGVILTRLVSQESSLGTLYEIAAPTRLLDVGTVRLPIHEAFLRSFSESVRLSKLTVFMFGNVLKSLVQKFSVPEGVSGPVGIARLTHVFVQEGTMAVLRFLALLSLSLAVINILPLPALDGGRLLFLLVEAVIGRRVNPRVESGIHAAGYALLILLIILVTYSDVVKLL